MKMNYIKYKNAMKAYSGFKGDRTINAVFGSIPNELKEKLTGKQIGMVASLVDSIYHNARKDISIEDDCIWVGLDVQKLILLRTLKNITKNELEEMENRK